MKSEDIHDHHNHDSHERSYDQDDEETSLSRNDPEDKTQPPDEDDDIEGDTDDESCQEHLHKSEDQDSESEQTQDDETHLYNSDPDDDTQTPDRDDDDDQARDQDEDDWSRRKSRRCYSCTLRNIHDDIQHNSRENQINNSTVTSGATKEDMILLPNSMPGFVLLGRKKMVNGEIKYQPEQMAMREGETGGEKILHFTHNVVGFSGTNYQDLRQTGHDWEQSDE